MPTVDRDALRAAQAPLKERYREDPAAALVTLTATGTLDDDLACNVQTGRALAKAGLHPATGGDGSLLCAGDMLLEALVACAGVTLKAVATALEIDVRAATIGEVESYDPRTRRWRYGPRLPTPRHGLGAVAYDGRIFVIEGGVQPGLTYSRTVEALRVAG